MAGIGKDEKVGGRGILLLNSIAATVAAEGALWLQTPGAQAAAKSVTA